MTYSIESIIKNKKLLIFDFDGTLADTTPLHANAFEQVLNPFKINFDYRLIAGMKTSDALRKCFVLAGIQNLSSDLISELADKKQRIVRNLISLELQPLPGINQLLDAVSGKYRLALVSSGSRLTVSLALAKLQLEDLFKISIFAEDVVYAKPSPEGFLKALELSGAQRGESLIFEDSEVGFEAAKKAQIDYVDIRSVVAQFHTHSILP